MQLSPVTQTFQAEDQSWLASTHGIDAGRSITMDVASFTQATHYPDGYLPSGLPLGVVTATGKYAPYNDAATDGTETLVGFLYTSVPVVGRNGSVATEVSGVILLHCFVVEANLPVDVNANGKTDVAGRIIFV